MRTTIRQIAIVSIALLVCSCKPHLRFAERDLVLKSFIDERSANRLKQVGDEYWRGEAKCDAVTLIRIAELQAPDLIAIVSEEPDRLSEDRSFFYSEALKKAPDSLEALYGISTTGNWTDRKRWLERWKRLEPENGLPYYLTASLIRATNRAAALEEIAQGNQMPKVIHHPLFRRFGKGLSDEARKQALAEWAAGRAPSVTLLALHQTFSANCTNPAVLLELLLFSNKLAAGIPLSGAEVIKGCNLGNQVLRYPALTNVLSAVEVEQEFKLRFDALKKMRETEFSESSVSMTGGILNQSTERIQEYRQSLNEGLDEKR